MCTQHPHLFSFLAMLPFVSVGMGLFFYYSTPFYSYGSFLACSFFGMGLSRCVFNRLATPEEKRADLEDHVQNPPL